MDDLCELESGHRVCVWHGQLHVAHRGKRMYVESPIPRGTTRARRQRPARARSYPGYRHYYSCTGRWPKVAVTATAA
eukprot:5355696-Prymnesium_polylepis.1